MNNQNPIPNFNLEDKATWRWNHRNLIHTSIEEAEASHIKQVSGCVGGVRILLSSGAIPHILDAVTNPNLPEPQPSIACRTAIFMSAQDVCKTSRGQARTEIDEFLNKFPDNLRVNNAQRTLIYKTIDSWCTARDSKDLNNFGEITQINLFHFFNYLLRDILPVNNLENDINEENYIRQDLTEPLCLNGFNTCSIFINCASIYLVRMFNRSADAHIRVILNKLIGNPQGAEAIQTAIQKEISADTLITSLNYKCIGNENLIANYIQLAADMVKVEGHDRVNAGVISALLSSREGTLALIQAAKANLSPQNLALGLDRDEILFFGGLKSLFLYNIPAQVDYMNLVAGLVNAPNSPSVTKEVVENLITSEEGSEALNLARTCGLGDEALAKALQVAIDRNNNSIANNVQRQTAYIKFLCEIIIEPSSLKKIEDVRTNAINDFLKAASNHKIRDAIYECFYYERIQAKAVKVLMSVAKMLDKNNPNVVVLANLKTYLVITDILAKEAQNLGSDVNDIINKFNEFITYAESSSSILYKASQLHNIRPESLTKLIKIANNNHDYAVKNIQLVIDLLASTKLTADEMNHYLELEDSSKTINTAREKKTPHETIIDTVSSSVRSSMQLRQQIENANQERVRTIVSVPAEVRIVILNTYSPEIRTQVIARLPEDIRNAVVAGLNQ